MTPKQLKGWLEWRKQVGLPPVPQAKINSMINDTNTFIVDQPRQVQAFRKVRYLFGLITVYKPIKLDK